MTTYDSLLDRPARGAESLPDAKEAPLAAAITLKAARWPLILFAAFGILYAGVARFAFEAFPYAGDEYSVVLQAKLFARGLLRAPAPLHPEWLGVDHVVMDAWVRSKYPPGTAALLSLGERAGVIWLVNPLLAVAALVVFWATVRRVLGDAPALAGLVALGLAPLFAFHGASFYSHTASTLFLTIAFAAVASWLRRPSPGGGTGWLVLTGAALGCGFLVRPLDAVLFGVAMLSLRSVRAVVVTAASALPFVGVNFAYQNAQYGSPLVSGYGQCARALGAAYGPQAAAPPLYVGCLVRPLQQWFHLDILRAFVTEWTVPGTALVAILGAYCIRKDHPARAMRTLCLTLIAISLVALLFTTSDPDDGARPRYLSPILVPVGFLAAAGFAPACSALEARFGRRARMILVALAALFGLAQLVAFVQYRVPLVWRREGVFEQAAASCARDAIIVVRAKYPTQYARSGPWFDGILYLSPPPTTSVEEIAAAYPGRQVWEAYEGDPWRFVRAKEPPGAARAAE